RSKADAASPDDSARHVDEDSGLHRRLDGDDGRLRVDRHPARAWLVDALRKGAELAPAADGGHVTQVAFATAVPRSGHSDPRFHPRQSRGADDSQSARNTSRSGEWNSALPKSL